MEKKKWKKKNIGEREIDMTNENGVKYVEIANRVAWQMHSFSSWIVL